MRSVAVFWLTFGLVALAVVAVLLGLMIVQPAEPGSQVNWHAGKADKLPVAAAFVAHPVRVIRLAGDPPPAVIPLPPPPPQRDLLEVNQPADTLMPRPVRHDPCVRYGGHRVVSGRHWHCRHD